MCVHILIGAFKYYYMYSEGHILIKKVQKIDVIILNNI